MRNDKNIKSTHSDLRRMEKRICADAKSVG